MDDVVHRQHLHQVRVGDDPLHLRRHGIEKRHVL